MMPLVFMGIKRGWYTHISKSPLKNVGFETYEIVDADADAALIAPNGDGDGGADEPKLKVEKKELKDQPLAKSVKHSNNESVRAARSRHINTLDFAAHVFCDCPKMRRLDVHYYCELDIMVIFKQGLVDVKTFLGQQDFLQALSLGSISEAIKKMWSRIGSSDCLRFLGFSSAGTATKVAEQEDSVIADLVLDVCTHLTYNFGLVELEYTHGLPSFFHLLISPTEAIRKEVFGRSN